MGENLIIFRLTVLKQLTLYLNGVLGPVPLPARLPPSSSPSSAHNAGPSRSNHADAS